MAKEEDPKLSHQLYKLQIKSTRSTKQILCQEMATNSSILAWEIPLTEGAWQATVHGVAKSQTQLSD